MEIDEKEIREKVRKSIEELDSSLSDSRSPDSHRTVNGGKIREITERIVAEETERHFASQGLVKYESSTGRVYWLTPEERDARLARRKKRGHRRKTEERRPIDQKKALAIGGFLLLVIVVVWILFETGVFNVE